LPVSRLSMNTVRVPPVCCRNVIIRYVGMVLRFRQLSFDTTHYPPGTTVSSHVTMFAPDPYVICEMTPVTQLDERSLVRWLMLVSDVRSMMFEALGRSSGAFYQPEVVEPFYAPGEGEIDLVICERGAPHEALVIEAKRVKVEIVNAERDEVHKIREVAKGVHQANTLYRRFGFFQHYLAVITAVDASDQTDSNIPCRGLRSDTADLFDDRKTFTRIVDFPKRDDLKPEIGIIFMEVVQPSRIAIDRRATFRVCVQHPANARQQADSVTRNVALLGVSRHQ
jgi:hypothetical protein